MSKYNLEKEVTTHLKGMQFSESQSNTGDRGGGKNAICVKCPIVYYKNGFKEVVVIKDTIQDGEEFEKGLLVIVMGNGQCIVYENVHIKFTQSSDEDFSGWSVLPANPNVIQSAKIQYLLACDNSKM